MPTCRLLSAIQPYDEKDLLLRIAKGDEAAFGTLFHAHHQSLGDYIYRLTGSKQAAQDIAQEAFVKAWQQRTLLSEINSFRSWLFTVSRNKALNAMRDQSRRVLRHEAWVQHQALTAEVTSSRDVNHFQQIVSKAVEALPPQQQRAYLLSREQGMKHADIADAMQLSPETVKRHISMALRAITDYIRTNYPDWLFLFLLFTAS